MKKKEDNTVFTKGCIQIVMKLFTKLILFSNRRAEFFYYVNYGSSIITSKVCFKGNLSDESIDTGVSRGMRFPK